MDNCYTPPYAVLPVLPYIQGMRVWEFCSGNGNLSKRMTQNGNHVISTDIEMGVDALTDSCPEEYDVIVTNPPFGRKFEFIERCFELKKPFALLMPVETHGAEKAQIWFEKFGISTIWLRPRISFYMPQRGWLAGGAQFPTAWFCSKSLVEKDNSWFNFNEQQEYQEWKKYIKGLKNENI